MSRRSTLPFAVTILWIGCWVSSTHGQDAAISPIPEFDPAGMVRFDRLPQANRRRDSLIRYIWPNGLPATRPKLESVMQPPELSGVPQSLVSNIERWEITVGDLDFRSIAFHLVPKEATSPATRVIVHHGHVADGPEHYLDAGVDRTIEFLLQQGCEVVVLQMPLVGWNDDTSIRLPDQTVQTIETRGTVGHRDLFERFEPHLQGETFSLFLEPVIQVVNELSAQSTNGDRLWMIGLSGGGWTTHMAAGLDVRIQCSIPVAGAMPLYAREHSPGSRGDTEQFYEPLYREVDRDGDGVPETAGGVASWLEIFALGGIGNEDAPRLQVQVLNLYDSCCFSGEIYRTYDSFLTKKVAAIGAGQWRVFIDRSHRDHLISQETLEKVVTPLLNSP